jgi:hypothetical protein
MPGYEGECGKMAAILNWLRLRSIFLSTYSGWFNVSLYQISFKSQKGLLRSETSAKIFNGGHLENGKVRAPLWDNFHTFRKFRLDLLKGLKVTAWTKFWLID